jgi:long-chain acyl-CoA synthetase
MSMGTLHVDRVLDGARIVVIGGTGFLGKILWSMLLDRYPNIGRLFLVVRPKAGETPEGRFWTEVATSEALAPLRAAHGTGFERFLRDKVVAIAGDMGQPLCGLGDRLLRELRGTIDAVVNVAGVVDFNPSLDDALEANAFGAKNVVGLARALGDARVLHTSTCYVAGTRAGPIREEDPCARPFPRADELGADLWDPEREIQECLDLIAQGNHRAGDAFRQSEFAERARARLIERGEPLHGEAWDRELARVKRRFVREQLIAAGLDRATHWGWPNIYLYTKAIGEQIVARSGLEFTIARPACCESCVAFPMPAYNEGGNTSAPLIYLIMKGQLRVLAQHVPLDLIPADYVVAGMIVALAELLEGTAAPVYQFGASDVNPCTAKRFGELVGIYKRTYYRRKASGNPLLNALQARFEPSFVDRKGFEATGAPIVASVTREIALALRKRLHALGSLAAAIDEVAGREEKVAEVQRLFEPFAAKMNGPFDCSNVRAGYARLSDEGRTKLVWAPESIDWADWMMNVHMPAMEQRIVPEMDRHRTRGPRPLAAHATLTSLVDEMAERHDLALALQMSTDEGLSRVTFSDIKRGAQAVAGRLASRGVKRGERVVLSADNHPDWAIAYFGIVRAGATVVPIDPALDFTEWQDILAESGARVVVWDDAVKSRDAVRRAGIAAGIDLHDVVSEEDAPDPPEGYPEPGDIASIVFASSPTGRPKGVTLTHANFTSLVASLAPLFPLSSGDAVVSVLPLHHTFEFTCGLVLPLSRGARVVYVGDPSGERTAEALRASRAVGMVGVPELWQSLERHILKGPDGRGPLARAAFEAALDANRWLSANVGVDAGRILFGSLHAELGGNIRWLLSGGPPPSRETQETFAGLGIALTHGHRMTDAATVGRAEVGALVQASPPRRGAVAGEAEVRDDAVALPEPVQELGKAILGKVLDVFYGDVMKPRVFGRNHIPHNRNVIVVANHASHLDMGFVRHALGKYGEDIVSLAAQDYFFESGIKRAFFANLTNLKAIDRRASLRQSIRQAGDVIERGKTVLIFPEGTRSETGDIQDFKPLVGHLALSHGVDILPIFLGGTHAAMAKGARLPTRRELVARIGCPLRVVDLRRLTAGMAPAPASREVARIAKAAVLSLRDGHVVDLSRTVRVEDEDRERGHPIVLLFAELEAKFRAGEVERAVSYYVTLGAGELSKWTVRIDAQACDVRRGKPDGGQADCVLKTSPEIFAKIVRESYVPSPADFLSGAVKSNDVALLMTFQRVFQLEQAS